ncbi:MAG: hypothetical protein QNJ36_01350 [Calothrix sp. MO_167.B42]|nr:hypothetical protein [Calothrix sp. MO_167.B42]
MLSISLDDEAEKYLVEILAREGTTSNELIKRLLWEHWSSLQSRKTVLERMGGYPENLLEGPSNLSDRDFRRKTIAQDINKSRATAQQVFREAQNSAALEGLEDLENQQSQET